MVHERLVGVDTAVKVDIPVHGWQVQQRGSPVGPDAGPSDVPAEASTMESEEGLSLEPEPEGALPRPTALPPVLAAAAAVQAAAGLPAVAPAAQQPQPLSEARQFMGLQQVLQQHRARVLSQPAAGSGSLQQHAGGMDQAAIALPPAPSPRPALPAVPAAKKPAVPAMRALPSAGSMEQLQRPASQAPPNSRQAGGSRWAGFLGKGPGGPSLAGPLAGQASASTSAIAPTQQLARKPPGQLVEGGQQWSPPAVTQQAVQSTATMQQPQRALGVTALQQGQPQLPVPQPMPAEVGTAGMAALNPGQLFSQFRCSKPGTVQRPAQAVLLSKLAGKQQPASAWRASAADAAQRPAFGLGEHKVPLARPGPATIPSLGPSTAPAAAQTAQAAPYRLAAVTSNPVGPAQPAVALSASPTQLPQPAAPLQHGLAQLPLKRKLDTLLQPAARVVQKENQVWRNACMGAVCAAAAYAHHLSKASRQESWRLAIMTHKPISVLKTPVSVLCRRAPFLSLLLQRPRRLAMQRSLWTAARWSCSQRSRRHSRRQPSRSHYCHG